MSEQRADAATQTETDRRRELLEVIPSDRLARVGLGIVLALLALAIVGPIVSPYDLVTQNLSNRLESPSLSHPLGTDQLGRDVLTRLLHGARLSQIGRASCRERVLRLV